MGKKLGHQMVRPPRRQGEVLPTGRAPPDLAPTKSAKMVPFQAGANSYTANRAGNDKPAGFPRASVARLSGPGSEVLPSPSRD